MAIEVAWSPAAIEDVESIAAYIDRDSPSYARSVVDRILGVATTLAEFPERGRVVPEIGQAAIRERFVYSYRIVYRVEPARILIVAVLHGRRLIEAISERF